MENTELIEYSRKKDIPFSMPFFYWLWFSSFFLEGLLPTIISSGNSLPSRKTTIFVLLSGLSLAIRLNISDMFEMVCPSTETRISPGLTPALSAGPFLRTAAIMTPSSQPRDKFSASSGVISLGSTPIHPLMTCPLLIIASITVFTVETGMAKPIPSEPPLRE